MHKLYEVALGFRNVVMLGSQDGARESRLYWPLPLASTQQQSECFPRWWQKGRTRVINALSVGPHVPESPGKSGTCFTMCTTPVNESMA